MPELVTHSHLTLQVFQIRLAHLSANTVKTTTAQQFLYAQGGSYHERQLRHHESFRDEKSEASEQQTSYRQNLDTDAR